MASTQEENSSQKVACDCKWRRVTNWLWPIVIGGVMIVSLSQLEVTRGTSFLESLNRRTFQIFILSFALAGLLLIHLWHQIAVKQIEHFWRLAGLILLVAMLLRIAGVMTSTPQLSDDIWRYLYDGKVLAVGENPYALSPEDRGPLRFDRLDESEELDAANQINNPSLVTIYPPVSQYGFASIMSVYIAGNQALDGDITGFAGERLFRFYLILLELLLMVLIAIGLRRMNASPLWLWLYAVHPLVLTEIMATGHQDIQGMVLWIGALLLWPDAAKNPSRVNHLRYLLCGLLWAGSLLVKPITLPVAVYLCIRDRIAWRGVLLFFASGVVSSLLLLLPFYLMPGGLSGLMETGRTFSMNWQFNGPLNQLLSRLVGNVTLTHFLMTGLVVMVGMIFAIHPKLVKRFCIWDVSTILIMLSLLVSSTVHPWYLLWALMFLPLNRMWSLHLFSLMIVLGYVAITHMAYQMAFWLSVISHSVVWAGLAFECYQRCRSERCTDYSIVAS